MATKALLEVGKVNKAKGKRLQDMGKYVTIDGYLIAATKTYTVELTQTAGILIYLYDKK